MSSMSSVRSLASRFESESAAGGTLQLEVHTGRNLASKDSSTLPNPFCVIIEVDEHGKNVAGKKRKTSPVSKSLNPCWTAEHFTIPLSAGTAGLLVEVWDEDKVGTHEFMGEVRISLQKDMEENNRVEKWFPLGPGSRKAKVSGDLRLAIEHSTKAPRLSMGPKGTQGDKAGRPKSSTVTSPKAGAGNERLFIKVSFHSEKIFKTILVTPSTSVQECKDMVLKKTTKGVPVAEQKVLLDKYGSWVFVDPGSGKQVAAQDSIFSILSQAPASSDAMPRLIFQPPSAPLPPAAAGGGGGGGGATTAAPRKSTSPNLPATTGPAAGSGSLPPGMASGGASTTSTALLSPPNGVMEISEPIVRKSMEQSSGIGSQQTTAVVEMLASKCNDLQEENERLKKKVEQQRMSRRGNQKNKLVVDLANVEVQERLAAIGGSLASVYAVYVDGWMCAMKEVFIENPEDASAVENEIALVEELPPHPNIVRYFFHQRTDRHLRLFMTKYAGTLSNFISKKREAGDRFSPEELKRFCLDIAKGLQYLHAHKIIHRDLKADNVFVTTNEKKNVGRCAVGDFDTAKKLSKDTVARTCIGTPSFIAPEVLTARERSGDYNFKADVYSYGMIVYEVLTLLQPYEGIPPLQISMRIIEGQRPEMPDLDDVYEPFKELHLQCTEMEPSQRPSLSSIIKRLEALDV
eukprot:TRINITY_DN5413_c1_g1_i1.p1 TRINITY_DN5413_c1_g1~~TRINITY_DN5413_c1_g1_i1.p1  ORF type:complete len:687 (-),score=167.45 TRINITY_DN5413_c1_g1_i1:361-2421(-)